ncbi:hypothetical protein [Blastococcus xanthinilyticus]|uniref:DUF4333 domain-containing protein n=1 Tax=Blastococcus xanthinilyticus TaxID=1564164 RepID=A0A5S5D470_9ACTN|nr:hypothetical protein [Blastococcus xanthinilyticus]TYP90817.1 hypothetical protein BD833_101536 [Blastococcus xanthinilyticus]
MSTDSPNPAGSSASGSGEPAPGQPVVPPVFPAATPTDGVGYGMQPGVVAGAPSGDPGWAKQNSGLLVAAMIAVVVVAIAIAGLILWRGGIDDDNRATEAAVVEAIAGQGGEVQSVECDGDTCAAIIGGQAYTVLVQVDEDGEQQFGIGAYVGD